MTVPYQYPSKPFSNILSVPMWHTIITMGMADLGGTSPDLEQAGERRLRRKRSPRCRPPSQTTLSWTRAPGAGLGGGSSNSGAFQFAYRWSSSIRIIGTFKGKSCSKQNEISLIFHGKSSNLPIDFVKIGTR
jgi:hypothetical protein